MNKNLAEAARRIFGTIPASGRVPVGMRTASKTLRKPFIGPMLVDYYPRRMRDPVRTVFEHIKFSDKRLRRLEQLDRMQRRGKPGVPKKGEGKRSSKR